MEENKNLGKRLKQARNEKGYTLDDLQQLTKIQKRYLIAIEENNLDELPGDFFVKAFIRQYAEVVDLPLADTESVTKELSDTENFQTNYREQLPSRAEMKRSSKETKFRYSNASQSNLPSFFVVLFFILILGFIWFYLNFMREDEGDFITDPNGTQPQVVAPNETTSNVASQAEEQEVATTELITAGESEGGIVQYTLNEFTLPNSFTMHVDETGRSWMQVLVNEQVAFEGTLEAGMSEEIPLPAETEQVSVRVGYIPATTLIFGEGIEVPNPDNGEIIQTQTFIFEFES